MYRRSLVQKSTELGSIRLRGNIKSTIEAIGKRKDEFKLDDGTTGYKTDIVADVNAGKIATWAIENDIDPNELPGLVASAYDSALTQKRQDGAKPNDLTPYLQQLVIRNRVRQNADAFKIPTKDGEPPQYIDTEKLAEVNQVAGVLMQQKGYTGTVDKLTDVIYNAAIADYNNPEEVSERRRKLYEKSAEKGENGFYLFLKERLGSYIK